MNINTCLKQLIRECGIAEPEDHFAEDLKYTCKHILTAYLNNESGLFIGSNKDIAYIKSLMGEDILEYQTLDRLKAEIIAEKVVVVYASDLQYLDKSRQSVYVLEQGLMEAGYTMVYGEKGVHCKQSLDSYLPHVYERISLLKMKLDKDIEQKEKSICLESLIYNFLEIRDFLSAEQYINCYISEGHEKKQRYIEFLDKLKALLKQIQAKLMKRNHKDIILFWNDALEYDDFQEMEFFKEYSNESLFFSRAYSYTPFTSASVKIMFDKKKQIENCAYDNLNFTASNSELYQSISEQGYSFEYFGLKGIADKLDIARFHGGDDFDPGMTRIWDAINCLLNSDKPVFMIIHECIETHMPWYSPAEVLQYASVYVYGDKEKETLQKKAAMEYWDKQFAFYSQFFAYDCTKIIFSDHGSMRGIRYMESNIHIMLYVKGPDITGAVCNRIFSVYNFAELVKYLLSPTADNFEKLFIKDNVALFEDADVYNELGVKYYVENEIKTLGMTFRGAVGVKDKYVLIGNGEEFYYLLPDEETNYIKENKYQARIEELRALAGQNFIDISGEDKFIYSRQLYE